MSDLRRRTMRWGLWALAAFLVLAPVMSVGSCSDSADPAASSCETHLASPLMAMLGTYYPVAID
ncbi:hypothetical protein [Demequina soli]|uniref:hypothetical protein n=1 Tax=Demequina soli TaxID=1638987 RepID=UPI000785C787|nr:hypothetical protein [Demequina soli]